MYRTSKTLLAGLIVLVLVLAGAAYGYHSHTLNEERDRMYATFTCTGDRAPILTSDAICAGGFRERITQMQRDGMHGRELFDETVMLMGLSQIIDEDLRAETYLGYADDPPASRATLELDSNYVDFGNVSESEEAFVMKEFTISNTGDKDLLITQIGTSCSCLHAKVIQNEDESPSMGRFSDPHGMIITIRPGDEARLRVTYDARVNSYFRGSERRYVYVISNDPIDPSQQITLDIVHVD